MIVIRDTFDFEIGYLAESPCKDCPNRDEIPVCLDQCRVLEEIQWRLARGVSCTGSHPIVD